MARLKILKRPPTPRQDFVNGFGNSPLFVNKQRKPVTTHPPPQRTLDPAWEPPTTLHEWPHTPRNRNHRTTTTHHHDSSTITGHHRGPLPPPSIPATPRHATPRSRMARMCHQESSSSTNENVLDGLVRIIQVGNTISTVRGVRVVSLLLLPTGSPSTSGSTNHNVCAATTSTAGHAAICSGSRSNSNAPSMYRR